MVFSSVEKAAGLQGSTVPPGTDISDSEWSSTLSFDRNVALAIVGEHSQEIDKAVEARVPRKIYSFLTPAMVVGTIMFNTIL